MAGQQAPVPTGPLFHPKPRESLCSPTCQLGQSRPSGPLGVGTGRSFQQSYWRGEVKKEKEEETGKEEEKGSKAGRGWRRKEEKEEEREECREGEEGREGEEEEEVEERKGRRGEGGEEERRVRRRKARPRHTVTPQGVQQPCLWKPLTQLCPHELCDCRHSCALSDPSLPSDDSCPGLGGGVADWPSQIPASHLGHWLSHCAFPSPPCPWQDL